MADDVVPLPWPDLLHEQLSWHWDTHLRPRLDGLGDEEYLWEPAPGAWSVRPRGTSTAPVQAGSGAFTVDFAYPEPDPPPVTTIAWRLAHLVVGVLGERVASHFDGPPTSYTDHDYAGTAAEALAQLGRRVRRAGTPGSAASGRRGWRGRAGPRRGRSPRPRSPRSSCTSTARSSTTAPRCSCCATCGAPGASAAPEPTRRPTEEVPR